MGPISPGASGQANVPLAMSPAKLAPGPASDALQVALKTNELNIAYFTDAICLDALLEEEGSIDANVFVETWKNLSAPNEASQTLPITIAVAESVIQKLETANIFLMSHKKVGTPSR